MGGSEKLIKVLDPAKSFKPVIEISEHQDCIFTIRICNDLIFSSAGNGWVLIHDLKTGDCLYGVTATKGNCRCIEVLPPKYLIAAGDDGKVIIFDY